MQPGPADYKESHKFLGRSPTRNSRRRQIALRTRESMKKEKIDIDKENEEIHGID